MFIGCACVSTTDQDPTRQLDVLEWEGCERVVTEMRMGRRRTANRARVCLRATASWCGSSTDWCDRFARSPWLSYYLPGIVDAPHLNLTPKSRNVRSQSNANLLWQVKSRYGSLQTSLPVW